MEYLDLEDNWIGIGGTFLGSALTSNISITYVNLSDNRLGRQSGLAIASMLSANKTLKTLLLAGIYSANFWSQIRKTNRLWKRE